MEDLIGKIKRQSAKIKSDFPQHVELIETAEEKLRTSEMRYRRISNNLALFSVSFMDDDKITGKDGQSIDVSTANAAAAGMSSEGEMLEQARMIKYQEFLDAMQISKDMQMYKQGRLQRMGQAPSNNVNDGTQEYVVQRFEKFFGDIRDQDTKHKYSKDEYSTKFKTLFATKELMEAVFNCEGHVPVMAVGHRQGKKSKKK